MVSTAGVIQPIEEDGINRRCNPTMAAMRLIPSSSSNHDHDHHDHDHNDNDGDDGGGR
jgi:hypothetical protein